MNNIDPHRTSTPYFNVSPDSRTDSRFILAVASSKVLLFAPISLKLETINDHLFTVSSKRTTKLTGPMRTPLSYQRKPYLNINKWQILSTTFTLTHPVSCNFIFPKTLSMLPVHSPAMIEQWEGITNNIKHGAISH